MVCPGLWSSLATSGRLTPSRCSAPPSRPPTWSTRTKTTSSRTARGRLRGSNPPSHPSSSLTSAYVGRPLAMGAVVADHLPRLVATGLAALEHECALAATEAADTVIHLSEVLCHRPGATSGPAGPTPMRPPAGGASPPSGGRGVVAGPGAGRYRIVRPAQTGVPVSIVIPFRDEPRLLRTCVDSVTATTGMHASVDLVLIDNGSSDPETLTLVEALAERPDVSVLRDPRPFNWAALNNAGRAAGAGGRPGLPEQRHRGPTERVAGGIVRPGAPGGRRSGRRPAPLSGSPAAALRPGCGAGGCRRPRPGRPSRGRARLPAHGDRGPRMFGGDRRLPGDPARVCSRPWTVSTRRSAST